MFMTRLIKSLEKKQLVCDLSRPTTTFYFLQHGTPQLLKDHFYRGNVYLEIIPHGSLRFIVRRWFRVDD